MYLTEVDKNILHGMFVAYQQMQRRNSVGNTEHTNIQLARELVNKIDDTLNIPSFQEQTAAQDKVLHRTFEEGTYTNEQGGKQTKLSGDLTLLPPQALLEIAKLLEPKAKEYGKDNWRKISINEHLNHAWYHIIMQLMGDTSENHLVNASCRILFALDVKERPLDEKGNSQCSKG